VKRAPTVRLVAGREISERVGSRTLRIVTAITTLLVVAGVVLPSLLSSSEGPTTVGLVGPSAQALAPALHLTAKAARVELSVADLASAASARAAVKDGSLDVALSVGERSATALVAQSLSATLRALLSATIDGTHQLLALSRAGVPPATARAALAPVPLATVTIKPPPSHEAARDIAALAAGLLLYLALGLYGNAIATGVAQEKTSRTAEVLLAAVRPRHLLTGKVLGIGLCGLGQLALAALAGLIANAIVHSAQIPSTIWLLLPACLLWFALGYTLYAFGYAAAGAIVARQEEVQFAVAPLAYPLVAGYLLVYVVIGSPHSTAIRVISLLPPFAPALMPARIAIGGLAWWELPLAVLLMLLAIFAMIRLSARVYTAALVRGGARLSWRAALRLGR
jgi:ABC-2 type transport system permease protein